MTAAIRNRRQPPATTIPPVTDSDIHGTAKIIVARYGDDAVTFAAQQMEFYRSSGNDKEYAIWVRIGMAAAARETATARAVAA